ncbi:hypothetical protein WG936_02555 [Corynebacterium sp. H127]|uniref:hypothetical protein n=1 Tax=Corynebacterium sp. H127 TaxID=3133418 RepID=UPI00309EB7A2
MAKKKKGTDAAASLYDDAVEALRNAAGGDWKGPAQPPEQVKDAIESTKGLDTDVLRESADDLVGGGKPDSIKGKGLLKQLGGMLMGVISGLIIDEIWSKAQEWFENDEQNTELSNSVSEAAESIDKVTAESSQANEMVCDSTKSQIQQLCALLATIDKTKFPDEYEGVLRSADGLINECASSVVGISNDRDRCIADIFNQILECGAQICNTECTPLPAACDAPPAAPPAQECESTPAMPTAPATSTGGGGGAAPAPTPAPTPSSPAPAPVEPSPQPAPPVTKPVTQGCPEEPVKKPAPPVTKPVTQDCPEEPVKKPAPPVTKPVTQDCPEEPVKKPAVDACPEEPESECEDKPEDTCESSDAMSGLTAVLGIGVVVAVIGAIVVAAEEFLQVPEPPVPEPAPEPAPPAPVEPPPPPKQNVPEPPPPPKQNVPEPPPPPKQNVPEPPPPPEPAPEPAPAPELVGSGVGSTGQARKVGAW